MSTMPLFAPTIPPTLTGTHLAVASLLLDYRGKGLLSSRDIAARVGLRHSADVRHICQSLVDDHGLWVCGDRSDDGGGYRIAESYDQFVAAQLPNLRQAITSIQRIGGRIGWKRLSREIFQMGGGKLLGIITGRAA
jgi:hypothetical protein